MDIIGIIGWGFNIVTWLIPSPKDWLSEKTKRKGHNQPFTYKNDVFARDTIRYRFRNTLHDLNDFYEDAIFKLIKEGSTKVSSGDSIKRPFSYEAFSNDLFQKPMTLRAMLSDEAGRLFDAFYDQSYSCYLGRKNKDFMTEAPFIDVEHHYYFYILNKYYLLDSEIQEKISSVKAPVYNDPYKRKKTRSITKDLEYGDGDPKEFSRILWGLSMLVKYHNAGTPEKKKILVEVIQMALNSNSYDLSQLNGRAGHILNPDKCKFDEIEDFAKFILVGIDNKMELNYLVDNSGVEFFSDLCLACILLSESVSKVYFHVNVLPIFVSDVIEDDFEHMVGIVERYIENVIDTDKKIIYSEGLKMIKQMFVNQQAEMVPSFIWNMPTPYKKVESNIFSERHSILIVKGDLNYRRLAEDNNWSYSKKLESLTKKYISCPTLVIRCFKSDLVLDYKWKDYRRNMKEDPDWRGGGEYGVVRFLNKKR